jgi:uncharacterized protein YabN with tetrapyrrole methylase and pyrophosphatase domain
VAGAEDVVANWEVIKQEEKGRASLMDGVSRHLPSLLYTHKLYRKAGSAGLGFGTAGEAAARATSGLATLAGAVEAGAVAPDEAERRMGEALAASVLLARMAGIDGESALRGWASRFRDRFRALEAEAAERGEPLGGFAGRAEVILWDQPV